MSHSEAPNTPSTPDKPQPMQTEPMGIYAAPQGSPVRVGDLLGWDRTDEEIQENAEILEFVENRRYELRQLHKGRGVIPCNGEPNDDELDW